MSENDRAQLLGTLADLCRRRAEFIAQALDPAIEEIRAALRLPEEPERPQPDAEEQRILDLWDGLEPGVRLSTATVLKMLDDSPTNGRQKRRLAEMVRRGFLANDGSGYFPA